MVRTISIITALALAALAPIASAHDHDKVDRLIDRLEADEPETPKDIIRKLRPRSDADQVFECFKHIEQQRHQTTPAGPSVFSEEGRFVKECLDKRENSHG